eukprot:TRINITY_DN123_c0_g2_i2.p1 TRINITY_DN123_c0_g2~~TRINITY_DN123_c0_g2_i2.p1  ORF type:complete len:409 (+),score=167.31 TRINITY_DN123_c0_g2_i2:80-1306(+)
MANLSMAQMRALSQMNGSMRGGMMGHGGGGGTPTQAPLQFAEPQRESSTVNMALLQKVVALLAGDREKALADLSKGRDHYPDLAVMLWYVPGVMTVLVQEVVSVYDKLLRPQELTGTTSTRVCNALALWQSIVNHKDTRALCVRAHLPLFLFPLLSSAALTRPMDCLRLTSLGVIGALVKSDDATVVAFLLKTELVPLCLRIMETGSELSKTVATFIVLRVMQSDGGLQYVCATPERFFAVSQVLTKITSAAPPLRLLKNAVRCYLRLSEHPKARDALLACLPEELRNSTFTSYLNDDLDLRRLLVQLLLNIRDPNVTALTTGVAAAAPVPPQAQAHLAPQQPAPEPSASSSSSNSSGANTPTATVATSMPGREPGASLPRGGIRTGQDTQQQPEYNLFMSQPILRAM